MDKITKEMLEIGKKDDTEKLDYSLLPFEAIEELVKVQMFGAKKYGRDNWKSLDKAKERYFSACMRHLVAFIQGEKIDKESGLSHLSHALCNIAFLIWYEKNEYRKM